LPERLGLLVGECRLRSTAADGLRVHARARASVQAAHHEAVTSSVEQRKGEALVAAGVPERVEPDEADPAEGALQVALDDRRPRRDGVDVLDDLAHPIEVAAEYRLERLIVAALGGALEPRYTPTLPTDAAIQGQCTGRTTREQQHDEQTQDS